MFAPFLCYYLLLIVLPPSQYSLRRNHDSGVLLTSPKLRTKKTLGERSFSSAAPRLWNLFPTTIRSISSLNISKEDLKRFDLIKHLISCVSCYEVIVM